MRLFCGGRGIETTLFHFCCVQPITGIHYSIKLFVIELQHSYLSNFYKIIENLACEQSKISFHRHTRLLSCTNTITSIIIYTMLECI
jgi:hypothetical protein